MPTGIFYRVDVLYKPMCWRMLFSQNFSYCYQKMLPLSKVFAHLVIMSVPHTEKHTLYIVFLRMIMSEGCAFRRDPLALWMQFCDKICDDLRYILEHHNL